jgi:hypothetical protein
MTAAVFPAYAQQQYDFESDFEISPLYYLRSQVHSSISQAPKNLGVDRRWELLTTVTYI